MLGWKVEGNWMMPIASSSAGRAWAAGATRRSRTAKARARVERIAATITRSSIPRRSSPRGGCRRNKPMVMSFENQTAVTRDGRSTNFRTEGDLSDEIPVERRGGRSPPGPSSAGDGANHHGYHLEAGGQRCDVERQARR